MSHVLDALDNFNELKDLLFSFLYGKRVMWNMLCGRRYSVIGSR